LGNGEDELEKLAKAETVGGKPNEPFGEIIEFPGTVFPFTKRVRVPVGGTPELWA
jgi:hypothetical protein